MPPFQELAPVDPARLQAVADWVETRVRPVLHVVSETVQEGDQPRQEFETRDYQIEAWAKLEMAREADRTRALGNLATGLGKTFVAAVDVMRYREECAAQDPPMYPRILYVSHKHDINEQASKTFAAIMPDAEIDFFKTQREQLPDADITFATIQSLYSELDRFDPQDFEYIVWDESHHLEAETFKTVRDYFDPLFEHAITATMERMDGKDIQDYFGEPLYQKTLPEGIAEGHLADVDYHIVFDKTIKAKLAEGFNPKSLKEIRDLFKDKPPIDEIARSIEEEIERLGLVNPKVIAFCESVEEAEALAATEFGGAAYHSGTTDRPQILGDFRSGRMHRITTRDMFNEGLDVPDADILIFLRGTGSPTIFEQQLGRGLRLAPGKTKVYVFDYVANVERIAKVRELSEAIQRRARQLGQGGVSEAGGILGEGDDDRGLHIHTEHGDFDFDSMAVDLLEKFGALQHPDALIASEEFASLEAAGRALHVASTTLAARAEELGWELPYRRFGSVVGRAISWHQIDELRGKFPDMFLEPIPDGLVSIPMAAQQLGVSGSTLERIIRELAWDLPRYKLKSNSPGYVLNDAQIESLRQHSKIGLEKAANGVVSVFSLAKELDSSGPIIRRLAAELGLNMEIYKFGTSSAEGLTEDQSNAVKLHPYFTRAAPEGYMTITAAAARLGVGGRKLANTVRELGWELPSYRFTDDFVPALSESQVETLATHILPPDGKAPDGYKSLASFATDLGSTHVTLKKLAKKYAIPIGEHQFDRSTFVASLSPESQSAFRALPELQIKKPPEGYLSIDAFVRGHGLSRRLVAKAIADNNIPTDNYHFSKTPTPGLSPEAQNRLLELPEFQLQSAPEGWVSVYALSLELGMARPTLLKRLRESGFSTQKFKFGSKTGEAVSPEVHAALRMQFGRR